MTEDTGAELGPLEVSASALVEEDAHARQRPVQLLARLHARREAMSASFRALMTKNELQESG